VLTKAKKIYVAQKKEWCWSQESKNT